MHMRKKQFAAENVAVVVSLIIVHHNELPTVQKYNAGPYTARKFRWINPGKGKLYILIGNLVIQLTIK